MVPPDSQPIYYTFADVWKGTLCGNTRTKNPHNMFSIISSDSFQLSIEFINHPHPQQCIHFPVSLGILCLGFVIWLIGTLDSLMFMVICAIVELG